MENTMNSFIKESGLDSLLVRAVVRQIGGWDSFKESAQDIANHGINGGFHGFIYYTDTCRFYAVNRELILEYARYLANDMGEELINMVSNFNCLRGNVSESEVGLTLYGTKKQHDTQVANALAWFAGEEVARRYVDCSQESA